jgi:hypothetical protein
MQVWHKIIGRGRLDPVNSGAQRLEIGAQRLEIGAQRLEIGAKRLRSNS